MSHWQLEASKLSQELAVWREKCERGEARRADLELKSSRQKNEIQHMSGELDKAQVTSARGGGAKQGWRLPAGSAGCVFTGRYWWSPW